MLRFQWKILFSSWPKTAIALGSALCIPFLFRGDTVFRALYQMDLYLTIPAAVLMAELFHLEYAHRTAEILYCTRRRKSVLFLQRFVTAYVLLLAVTVLVFLEYNLLYEGIRWDVNRNTVYILQGLAGIAGTLFFFGTLSVTVTDLTKNYFMGIGAALALFLLFYYLPPFRNTPLISLFTLHQTPGWPLCKLFYTALGLLLLWINDLCIQKSPVK